MRRSSILVLLLLLLAAPDGARAARLKDVANIRGVRSNQLIGYGLVVGLGGTGDDQQVYFTLRSVQLMLRRLGVQAAEDKVFDLKNLRLRNTAAVMVSATLPPFARTGNRLDVTVSSLGNAKSLQGGVLLMTPMRGVDLKIYALAQGALSLGGFKAEGGTGSSVSKNHALVARVPEGALVEREVPSRFVQNDQVVVALQQPDFTTATRLASAINKELGGQPASSVDPGTILVRMPPSYKGRAMELASRLELVQVQPDAPAQVVINERTGTVVVGQEVRLSPVAVAHGNLTVEISEKFKVSQPKAAFGTGRTVVTPETKIKATEGSGSLQLIQGTASLSDVVRALNALNATPRDLVAIFQALAAAGALPAKLVVQ